jgi:hypothetical protein
MNERACAMRSRVQGGRCAHRRLTRPLRSRFSDVPAWQVSAVGTKSYVACDGIRGAPAETLRQHRVIAAADAGRHY